jgi:pimeloyl-ACP methyl ester carboxylesterase
VERRRVNGIELEFETQGSGDAVLFVPASHLAGGFKPLMAERSLADHHQLICYHRRGMAGSTHTEGPVIIPDQASDAIRLLWDLSIERAHVVGHSYGGLISLQLAIDAPEMVGSLALLEPNLLAVPGGAAFNDEVRPAFQAYRAGDKEKAVAYFLSVVAGLPWDSCRELIEKHVPGGVDQAIADADTFFTVEVPTLRDWPFGTEEASRVTCPVLSVLGSESHTFFRESRELLRSWFPQLEQLDISAAGHLLQLQSPGAVGNGLASFFSRHPLGSG